GEGGRRPRRHHVGGANVASRDLGERGHRRLPSLSWRLEGEAHEGEAIAESLSLLDLEVDEESKEQVVDDPRSGVRGWVEAPFTHDEVLHLRAARSISNGRATYRPTKKYSRNQELTGGRRPFVAPNSESSCTD